MACYWCAYWELACPNFGSSGLREFAKLHSRGGASLSLVDPAGRSGQDAMILSICHRRERRACCDSAMPTSCASLGWSILSRPGGPLGDQVTPAGINTVSANKISRVLSSGRIKSALRPELSSRAWALIARPLASSISIAFRCERILGNGSATEWITFERFSNYSNRINN
jgi:hypothetical protein